MESMFGWKVDGNWVIPITNSSLASAFAGGTGPRARAKAAAAMIVFRMRRD